MFNLFKRKKRTTNLINEDGKIIKESSLVVNKNGKRFLKLDDSSCAMILHDDNNVEVIFTKLYDNENQTVTKNEEVLMAIALFMKQPGFLDMIVSEFRKIAMERISTLTDEGK